MAIFIELASWIIRFVTVMIINHLCCVIQSDSVESEGEARNFALSYSASDLGFHAYGAE